MDFSYFEILGLLILGAGAGILSTYFGLGGGVLFASFIPVFFGASQVSAIGTSLFTVFLINCANVVKFHRKKLLRWKVAFLVIPASAAMSFLGGEWAKGLSERYLVLALLLTLVFLAIWTVIPQKKGEPVKEGSANRENPKAYKMIGVGAFSGGLGGLTGIGAGAINSAFLMNWKLVKPSEISATANAIMAPTTFFGAISYSIGDWSLQQVGHIRLDLALGFFVVAYFFASIGHRHQHKMSDKNRKWALAVILFVLSAKEAFRLAGIW